VLVMVADLVARATQGDGDEEEDADDDTDDSGGKSRA
jgi:hypothetical protein